MKAEMLKQHGGLLIPADHVEADKMKKFKTGEQYQITIVRQRNPAFHRKMFSFFKFCFEYWSGDQEFLDEAGQFEVFRKSLTINAGFYTEYYTANGHVTVEAKSISYGSMSQEEFEQHYNAVIDAAMKLIFGDSDDVTRDKLIGFF